MGLLNRNGFPELLCHIRHPWHKIALVKRLIPVLEVPYYLTFVSCISSEIQILLAQKLY